MDFMTMALPTLASAAVSLLAEGAKTASEAMAHGAVGRIGEKMTDWIVAKLGNDEGKKAITKVKANPKSEAAKLQLQGQLLEQLESNPAIVKELRDLLRDLEGNTTTQAMNIRGDHNDGIQNAGNNNTIVIKK